MAHNNARHSLCDVSSVFRVLKGFLTGIIFVAWVNLVDLVVKRNLSAHRMRWYRLLNRLLLAERQYWRVVKQEL